MKSGRLITRRRAKWLGTILVSLLLPIVALGPLGYSAEYRWNSPNSRALGMVAFVDGGIYVVRYGGQIYDALEQDAHTWPSNGVVLERRMRQRRAMLRTRNDYGMFELFVSMWIPFIILAIPTAYLWGRDGRPKPWQCAKCRYDLRGLEGGGEGGVCPECGTLKGSEA